MFFTGFSKLLAQNELKQQRDLSRPAAAACCDGESQQSGGTALRPSAHRVLPLAVARSRCPGPEYKNWANTEIIPLDIVSWLPVICCLRAY